MTRFGPLVAATCLLLAPLLSAQPAQTCEQWNTEAFFRTVTVSDVTACLNAGLNVSARTEDGYTPLHHAAQESDYPEVVNALLEAGADPDSRDVKRRPVIYVSWHDAQAYASWLSLETGAEYRLPSEAEWEYAARAGSTTVYCWDNEIGSNRANCDGCGSQWDDSMTVPVGSFGTNAWGLHDTLGNIKERVEDLNRTGFPGGSISWEDGVHGTTETVFTRGTRAKRSRQETGYMPATDLAHHANNNPCSPRWTIYAIDSYCLMHASDRS